MAAAALVLIGLAAGPGNAAVSRGALTSAPASQKISTASELTLNATVNGGGHNIDFWKVKLTGGYRLSFSFTAGSSGGGYGFDLYAPSTKDATFYQTGALVTVLGPGSGGDFTLQAPYTGTFILAVCQAAQGYNVPTNCASADPPSGGSIPPSIQNPMSAYTFTAGVEKEGITSSEAAGETKATTTITAAPTLSAFESGGGQNIDFWKVHLTGGYAVQFFFTQSGSFGGGYGFDLYAPATKDGTFYQTGALVTDLGPGSGSGFTLQAPYTGTFILAVCQAAQGYNVPTNCASADPPSGGSTPASIANPMSPYTFATSVLTNGITTSQGAGETQASATITGAPALGSFESGGGQNIDFWKVSLKKGETVSFNWTASGSFGGGSGFNLYSGSTTDADFFEATPVATVIGPGSPGSFGLQAPSAGTFILAVCQAAGGYNVPGNCGPAHPPGGESPPASIANPMSPYTFTVTLPPPGPALKVTTAPAVSGTPTVGSTLSVTSGVWSPAATSYSYQWYLASKPISGATSSFLPLTTADKGSVYVVVTAYKVGYVNGSYKSTPVTVTS
ncbi:MAG TPA: hypothetical protein VHY58_00380 [Streptosporangiaceae bacterium]|nr:hypothetical protein [Streptosporangiaceae bacterium]